MATKGKLNVDFALRYVGAIGANRYVANVDRYSTIEWKDIVFYAARAAHVPESSIEVAMDALYDALNYFVLNGHNVKIDGIGTFYFGINAGAEEAEEDAGAASVKRLKIGLLPEMSLRQALNNVAITTTTSNPGNLLVDQSVPPKITDVGFSTSQNGEYYLRYFGSEVKMVNGELYMRLYGQRMRRAFNLSISVAFYKNGEYVNEGVLEATLLGVTAKYAAYHLTISENDKAYEADTIYLMDLYVRGDNTSDYYFYRSFDYPDGSPEIEKIIANGKEVYVMPDQDVEMYAPAAEKNTLIIYGANLNTDNIEPENATATLVSASRRMLKYDISGVTDEPVYVYGHLIHYPVADGQPTVTSLTANGVSVGNNQSSTITKGESYNFVFAGTNLGGLTAANLNVPAGSSVSNFAASANQIKFTLTNAQAGVISISYNGSTLFSVTVTEYTGGGDADFSITTIGSVANGGSYNVSGKETDQTYTLAIAGSGLNNLAASNFVQMRSKSKVTDVTFTLQDGSDTARTLQWTGYFKDGDQLLVQNGDTTLFTLNITGSVTVSI